LGAEVGPLGVSAGALRVGVRDCARHKGAEKASRRSGTIERMRLLGRTLGRGWSVREG
jgi:hypothetical protein